MKKLISICVMVIVAITLHAQAGYQAFTVDTLKGAQLHYKTATVNVVENGMITFQFTADGFAADSAFFTLQGSNDNWTTAHTVSTQGYKSATATSYNLSQSPALYLRYRLKMQGIATDTVRINNLLFIYKK